VYVLCGVHIDASGPAFGNACAELNKKIDTKSFVIVPHVPLLMVQRKIFSPTANPVTPLVGEVGLVIDPEPETKVHTPVAGNVGVFPPKVADVVGKQNA